jgi:hypothetical protein
MDRGPAEREDGVLPPDASRPYGLTSANLPRVSWEVGRPICFITWICSGAAAIMS